MTSPTPLLARGTLALIIGPIGSGKSSELIRRVRRCELARLHVQRFKSHLDTRYAGVEHYSTHAGDSLSGVEPIRDSADLWGRIDPRAHAIAIDEVQFLDHGVIDVVSRCAARGQHVMMAGTDIDFRGQPFGAIPNMVPVCEEVLKLTAICRVCGDPAAIFNQRLINGHPASADSPLVMVGSDGLYEARCRPCFVPPHAVAKPIGA